LSFSFSALCGVISARTLVINRIEMADLPPETVERVKDSPVVNLLIVSNPLLALPPRCEQRADEDTNERSDDCPDSVEMIRYRRS
jgi:hypothetical protein